MPNLPDALIGYTGFVGSNLLNQRQFERLYNSKNIEEIQNNDFNLVMCAAAPSVKWLANKEPADDLAAVTRLITNLKKIKAKKFVLISTIDVYPNLNGVDEDSPIAKTNLSPYGKHRLMLEEFVAENFDSLIIRLPAIYGRGMKKNPLFDLMRNDLKYINPESVLQFYYLDYLLTDIGKSLANNLKLINFATEPISLGQIAKEVFNIDLPSQTENRPAFYDMRTKHANFWKNTKPYLYLKNQVIMDIKNFVSSYRC
jgi:nucleoside-diphosphate-sugar epimerase